MDKLTTDTPFTRCNRFDDQLYCVNKHPTGNWLDVCLHDTAGHQNCLTIVLNDQPLFVQPVVKPGCTTGLTTCCIHDTTGCQTDFKPVWQQVVSCKRDLSELMCYYTEIAIFSCLFTTLHRMPNSTQRASTDSGCKRTHHPASNISLFFQLMPCYIT